MKFNKIKYSIYLMTVALLISVSGSLAAASRTVIVLPFLSDGNTGYSWVAYGISDYLERAMRGNNQIGVIPASEVKIISKYLNIESNMPIPPDTIAQLARLSGADDAVSVRYFVSNGRLTISIEIISGTDNKVRKSFSFSESVERIPDIQDAMYRGIVTDEKPTIPKPKQYRQKTKKGWVTITKSNPYSRAYEWYSRGIECVSRDPRAALSLFVKTLHYDPEYTPAFIAAAEIAHHEQGMIDGALGYLLRADKIFVRRGESSTTKYAMLMVKIADLYMHKHDYSKSQIYISRAFDVWKKRKNLFPDEYASFLVEVGSLYTENHSYMTAADFFSMACDVYEKRKRTGSLRYAWIMRMMADSYRCMGRDAVAIDLYNRSELVFINLSLADTSDYAEIEFGKGRTLAALGKIDESKIIIDNAYKLFLAHNEPVLAREAMKFQQDLYQPMPKRIRD